MGRWTPGEDVRPSEVIGRRIFDKTLDHLKGVESVPNIFFDTRLEDDLSLDRLGDGQPHRQTVAFLTPLCDSAAQVQGKIFGGWLAAQRKHIRYENVRADALTLDRDGIDNPFHALLDRSAARERGQAFHLSRSLLMSFKESGQLVAPIRRPSSSDQPTL